MANEKMKKVVIGSVDMYLTKWNNPASLPEWKTIATEENHFCAVKNGASFEYKTESTDDSDDLGYVKVNRVTKETVTFKAEAFTWNGETIKTLCPTAEVTTAGNMRTIKIGGLGKYKDDTYLILCVHKDSVNGDMRIWVRGNNTSGFTFKFDSANASTLPIEIVAQSLDSTGTLLQIEEDIPADPVEEAPAAE